MEWLILIGPAAKLLADLIAQHQAGGDPTKEQIAAAKAQTQALLDKMHQMVVDDAAGGNP